MKDDMNGTQQSVTAAALYTIHRNSQQQAKEAARAQEQENADKIKREYEEKITERYQIIKDRILDPSFVNTLESATKKNPWIELDSETRDNYVDDSQICEPIDYCKFHCFTFEGEAILNDIKHKLMNDDAVLNAIPQGARLTIEKGYNYGDRISRFTDTRNKREYALLMLDWSPKQTCTII